MKNNARTVSVMRAEITSLTDQMNQLATREAMLYKQASEREETIKSQKFRIDLLKERVGQLEDQLGSDPVNWVALAEPLNF